MSGVTRSGAGSNRVYSEQEVRAVARAYVKLEQNAQQMAILETESAQHKQNVKDLTAARANLETGNNRRADTRAKLAAKQNLLNK